MVNWIESHMARRLAVVVTMAVGTITVGCAQSTPRDGYVLKRGEGERLFNGEAIIKASPESGTQGAEMFWTAYDQEFSTGVHFHHTADEFFYVVSGSGFALVSGGEVPIEAGDVVFVPAGQDHRLRTSGPLEIVFLVDEPGLASEFREAHVLSNGGQVLLTLEQLNQISQAHGTTYRTLE